MQTLNSLPLTRIVSGVVALAACVCGIQAHSASPTERQSVSIESFGVAGDGLADDTAGVQRALTHCSRLGVTCIVPKKARYLVTAPLYMWGSASLEGQDLSGTFVFKVDSAPYLINLGISRPNGLEKPFTGKIRSVTFEIAGGKEGRILFFWRTIGAEILGNVFDVKQYAYSATSSGNDNNWVGNGFANCIRRDIRIQSNTVKALGTDYGSEGFGLGHFSGALIAENIVDGVGDDPIGIHYSDNIVVRDNDLRSVDGRLYVSNSRDVLIEGNTIQRVPSPLTRRFYEGIALIYIGFEIFSRNDYPAPTGFLIRNNELRYASGAIDSGAAIYLYAPREGNVVDNRVVNDSQTVTASALHILPVRFESDWTDPDRLDGKSVARVHRIDVTRNESLGANPLSFKMTGMCVEYVGPVTISENIGPSFAFYCESSRLFNNTVGRN
jgi:hypothetical protein